MKKAVFSFMLIFSQIFSISLQISNTIRSDGVNDVKIALHVPMESFEMKSGLIFSNDRKYVDPITGRFYFGYHYDFAENSLKIHLKNLSFKFGRFHVEDSVKSPYTLFSSSRDFKTLNFELSYENENFLYTDTWIGLTREVHTELYDFPNRGANLKIVALKLGKFRVGYQEAVVYTGRFFDLEYFANPVPNFFTQYILYVGRPFKQGTNDNSILGFFSDWSDENLYTYLQILIDDFNMNRFYGGFQNPDKLAWSLGAEVNTSWGVLSLYHAGATKYTFEPVSSDNQYGYVLYPAVLAPVGDATRILFPEENYLGYEHGENNLAFKISWKQALPMGSWEVSWEYVVSGSVSPINPWHDSATVPEGTHILDDETLRNVYNLKSRVSLNFFRNAEIFMGFEYEKIFNDFILVNASDGDGAYLKPLKGNDQDRFHIELGMTASFEW